MLAAFASDLEAQLPTAISARTAPFLVQDIHEQISNIPNKRLSAAESRCGELDNRGTSLWNLCTRLRRIFDSDNLANVPPILLVTRVFAFLLLDCAYENGNNVAGNFTRLLKISVKAAKSCLGMQCLFILQLGSSDKSVEAKDLNLALMVLEKIRTYEERLEKGDVKLPLEDQDACAPLVAEYYVLRTAVVRNPCRPRILLF